MKNEAVVTVLESALTKIKRGWCQGAYAKTADGERAGIGSPDACSWCSMGAIDSAGKGQAAEDAAQLVRDAVGVTWLFEWNDDPKRTKAEVIQVFEAAIKKARQE